MPLTFDHSPGSPSRQSGVTLVIILLFMATLAIGGLYTARSALMGEKLARNQLDYQVARQAAEAALRDAELDLMISNGSQTPSGAGCSRGSTRPVLSAVAYFNSDCLAGQCQFMTTAQRLAADYSEASAGGSVPAEPWWPRSNGGKWEYSSDKPGPGSSVNCATFTGGVPLGTYTGAKSLVGVSQQPEYLIEAIRRGSTYLFRITSRGFGVRPGSEVAMQSYFQIPEL